MRAPGRSHWWYRSGMPYRRFGQPVRQLTHEEYLARLLVLLLPPTFRPWLSLSPSLLPSLQLLALAIPAYSLPPRGS